MLESYNPLGTVQLPSSGGQSTVDVGAMVFLKAMEVTTSTSALDFDYAFDSTYDDYVLRVTGMTFTAGNSENIGMQFFINGSRVSSPTYSYTSSSLTSSGVTGVSTTANAHFLIGNSSFMNSGHLFSGEINLVNAASTTLSKGYFGHGAGIHKTDGTATNNANVFNGTLTSSSGRLTGLRFFFAQNNSSITGGKFALYGIRKAAVRVSP